MMAKLKDVLGAVGDNAAGYAHTMRCKSRDLARTVGPKRGGIALGVLAVAIATPFVIRFLRNRRAEIDVEEQELAPEGTVKRRRRRARGTNAPNAIA